MTASSINGAWKPGQLNVNERNLEHFLTPHMKIKGKMDQRPKGKTRNYKTLREKHRQNT